MTIIDISWPISTATTGYKDAGMVRIQETKTFNKDGARESLIQLSAHTGTHIDAPAHFLRDGATIDELSLHTVIGTCQVLDMTVASDCISADHLRDTQIKSGDIILFKTANSLQNPTEKFSPHFIYVHISAAEYLAEKKVKAVGIDYLGIERSQPGHPTHITLMKAGITIIEGLRLGHVSPGRYEFVALPLLVIGTEAAPARAVLIEE